MQSGTRETGVVGNNEYFLTSNLVIGADLWSPLQLYSIYRLILAGLVLILGMSQYTHTSFEAFEAQIFSIASSIYLVFSVLCVFTTHFRQPSFTTQLFFHAVVDISFLLIIVYLNSGLNSGLGILLLLPVILPSILQPGQASLLLSALTVIALFTIETILQIKGDNQTVELFHVGILSLFIMMISW